MEKKFKKGREDEGSEKNQKKEGGLCDQKKNQKNNL